MGDAGSFFRFCDPEFQGASLVLSVGVKAVGDLSRAVGSWLLGVARSSCNVSLCSVSSGCALATLFLFGGNALGSAVLRSPPQRPNISYWLAL